MLIAVRDSVQRQHTGKVITNKQQYPYALAGTAVPSALAYNLSKVTNTGLPTAKVFDTVVSYTDRQIQTSTN